MSDFISEPGMDFIAENTFHIEQSNLYKKIGKKIHTVEFVRVKDGNILFVEAKSSFPNPKKENSENSDEFILEIGEICEKFKHSLNLFSSVKVGVAEETAINNLPVVENALLAFVLVINGHKFEWLKPIENSLVETLPSYLKTIWKPKVFVINEIIAKSRGLIAELPRLSRTRLQSATPISASSIMPSIFMSSSSKSGSEKRTLTAFANLASVSAYSTRKSSNSSFAILARNSLSIGHAEYAPTKTARHKAAPFLQYFCNIKF